jgi:heme A synthase
MKFEWRNQVGFAASVCAFVLLAEGAVRVSAQLPVSMLHRGLGGVAAAGALVLAASLWAERRQLSKLLILLTVASALLGGMSENPAWKAVSGVGHAVASHLFAAIAFLAWRATREQPGAVRRQPLEDGGWPSLRSLAWFTPAVIVAQIALGAAYRHQLASVVPHVLGAFVAAVVVLMAGAAVFTTSGTQAEMRRLAGASLGLLVIQILLGVAAYFARVSGHSQLVAITVSHVVTGAALLTVNCVLSSRIWKEVVTVRESAPAGELAGSGRNG